MVVSVAGPGGTAVQGVSVLLDGKEVCQDSACKIADLKPGSYVIKARAEGYAEMAGKAYEIASGEQKAINIEMVMGKGTTGLKVSSDDSSLILTVDGKKIGALPQELANIEPGKHTIKLAGSPFIKKFEKTITIKKGEVFDFEPELELAKGQINIKLDESAQGAKVSLIVNGKRRSLASTIKKAGSKPVKIDLPVAGKTYKLRATRKGYEKFEEVLEFSVGEPIRSVTITLLKEGEDDEEEATHAPRGTRTLTRAPSRNNAPTRTKKPATSGKGKININSIPKSTVILDGRPLGSTPKIGVSVSAGTHTVVFVHPKFGRKVRQLKIAPGGTGTAAVRFP